VDRQVPSADEHLYPVLKRYLDRVLAEMPREDDLLASIRRAVGESLRDGDPNLAQVARKIAMGQRTLQRRLREQGVDFKWLVDDTRRRFSLNYLRERKHTLSEIACLLGYSEVSALNRAFRRWTGSTPSDYRRRAASDASRAIGSGPTPEPDVTARRGFIAPRWGSRRSRKLSDTPARSGLVMLLDL
jgi:AraC-like DNA-binding protein